MGADAKPPATARMVRDNPALTRYELKLGDATAFATYVREPGRITLIPPRCRKNLADTASARRWRRALLRTFAGAAKR